MISNKTAEGIIIVFANRYSRHEAIDLLRALSKVKGNTSYTMSVRNMLKVVKKMTDSEWNKKSVYNE